MDIATLVLAIWGAILSTILGIREIVQEKRSLSVILERVYFAESYQLIISNRGYRPVTIVDIVTHVRGIPKPTGIKGFFKRLFKKDYYFIEAIHDPATGDDDTRFPLTLEDSKSVTIPLGRIISDEIIENDVTGKGQAPEIFVLDSEGKEYKISKRRGFNPKYKWYNPIK